MTLLTTPYHRTLIMSVSRWIDPTIKCCDVRQNSVHIIASVILQYAVGPKVGRDVLTRSNFQLYIRGHFITVGCSITKLDLAPTIYGFDGAYTYLFKLFAKHDTSQEGMF